MSITKTYEGNTLLYQYVNESFELCEEMQVKRHETLGSEVEINALLVQLCKLHMHRQRIASQPCPRGRWIQIATFQPCIAADDLEARLGAFHYSDVLQASLSP